MTRYLKASLAVIIIAASLIATTGGSAGAATPSAVPVFRLRAAQTIHAENSPKVLPNLRIPKYTGKRLAAMSLQDIRTDSVYLAGSLGVATCGIITCTFYFNRAATKWLNGFIGGSYSGTKAAIASTITGIACSFLASPLGGAICAGFTGVMVSYIQEAFQDATDHHQCATMRFVKTRFLSAPLVNAPAFLFPGKSNGRWCQ